MAGAPIRLGPFVGGLNLASDPTAIADAELTECHNFELDLDGSLISRPPYQEKVGDPGFSERILILCEAVFGTDHYLMGSNASGIFYWLDGQWNRITTSFQASAAVQYANKVYLVPHPNSGTGGKWDPVGGFTAVAAIPKGQAAVVHKERLFVVPGIESSTNSSRLTFSDSGDFDSWTGTNFIDIGQGDGTKLIDLTVFQNNLILFKNQSTYFMSYDVRPSDAVVQKISSTIGVGGQFQVVNYENQVYCIHNGAVYEILNLDFNRINIKVPFVKDESLPVGFTFSDESVFLTLLGDRLICRFYKKVYVYGLQTRSWSEWESTVDILQYFGPITILHAIDGNEYYAGSSLQEGVSLIQFYDKHTASDTEQDIESTSFITDSFTRSVTDGWGSATSGQAWTVSGGAGNPDFDVTGTKGTHLLSTTNTFRNAVIAASVANQDITVTVETSALAAGANQTIDLLLRYTSANDTYYARVEFTTTATVVASILKTVSAAQSTLTTGTVASLTHVANTQFKIRARIIGTQLAIKVWLASSTEPLAWNLSAYDSSLSAAGSVGVRSMRNTGNTNANLLVSFDNLQINTLAIEEHDIECWVRTKNFDMAVSHQYKRLWWWGADVSTSRDIEGTASPIVVNFQAYWGDLDELDWGDELDNYWGQPLSDPAVVDTLVTTSSGVARQFVKFLKALRYRQINFKVKLLTKGSRLDGPARLFSMSIITETRQVVPKAVN